MEIQAKGRSWDFAAAEDNAARLGEEPTTSVEEP